MLANKVEMAGGVSIMEMYQVLFSFQICIKCYMPTVEHESRLHNYKNIDRKLDTMGRNQIKVVIWCDVKGKQRII